MLSKSQIKHITRSIQSKRLKSFRLEEELVDFVTCTIEEKVQEGMPFESALENVLKQVESEQLAKIPIRSQSIQKPNSIDMIQNYLTVALRNFIKHRSNSLVNSVGLFLALTSVLIIGMYINYEFSYDRTFPDVDRVYRVNGTSYMGDKPSPANFVSPLLIDAMLEEIPEVEYAASGLTAPSSKPMKILEKNYFGKRVDFFPKDVFEIFGIKVLAGSIEDTYDQPFGVMVSESFAASVFGNESPLNQVIDQEIYGKPRTFTVLGVFEDIPEHSHLSYGFNPFDLIGNRRAWEIIQGSKGAWNSTHMPAYVKLTEGSDREEVSEKINDLVVRRAGEDAHYRHYLQPVKDVHLNRLDLPTGSRGDVNQVITFALIGLLILVIACINYVNLATARVTIRMKEVGVRKVLGANKKQFLLQFITEAFLMTLIALMVSVGLVMVSLDFLNNTFDLSLSMSGLESGRLVLGLFVVLFFISIVSGGYPGLYLSGLKSTLLLKSSIRLGKSRFSMRKVLVVLQFGVSAAIIICTIVVVRQLSFLSKTDLGYDKESIVYVNIPGGEVKSKGVLFRDALDKLPIVKSSSLSRGSLARGNFSGNGIRFGTETEYSMQRILPVDFDMINTMGFELVEGRWFDADIATDMEHAFVVNEAFLKYFEIQDALGTKMSRNEQSGEIIGVTKNFHWKSMHSEIEPLVMFMQKDYSNRYGNIVIKLNPGDLAEAERQIGDTWTSIFGDRPFEWDFLDEQLAQVYRKDQIFGDIFTSFSVIAIVISCLGLLGLVSFSVERRLKEIGVRKVLGASISSILVLISKDFSRLVIVGFILAIPAAYFFTGQWLENFEYRIEVGYWPFVIACFITILIAWASVSFISLRAAKANPVDSLRTE